MTPKQILILNVHGHSILTMADQPFFVPGRGRINARDLHAGDQLRTADGQIVASPQQFPQLDAHALLKHLWVYIDRVA